VKLKFSSIARVFGIFAHSQSDQAARQQGTELGPPLGRGHLVRREGVRAYHAVLSFENGYMNEKPVSDAFRDI